MKRYHTKLAKPHPDRRAGIAFAVLVICYLLVSELDYRDQVRHAEWAARYYTNPQAMEIPSAPLAMRGPQ